VAASSLDRLGAMRRRSTLPLVALGGAFVVLILALAAYLYDHSRRDVIANGVRIDGIAVGGMHRAAAQRKLERELAVRLDNPVTVRSGARSWSLGASEARLAVDVPKMVAEAVQASREGSIVTRTARGLFGGSVKRDIPLAVSYSHQAVRALAASVRTALDRPPRDATVQPSAGGPERGAGAGWPRGRLRGARRPRRPRAGGRELEPHGACARAQGPAGRDDGSAGGEVSGLHRDRPRDVQTALLQPPETVENLRNSGGDGRTGNARGPAQNRMGAGQPAVGTCRKKPGQERWPGRWCRPARATR